MGRAFVAGILMVFLTASCISAEADRDHANQQGMPGREAIQEMQKYNYEANQKFMRNTEGLIKELHNKRFEYYEALRNPDTEPEKVPALENEIWDLQRKIFDTWQKQFYGLNGRGGGI